MNDTVTTLYQVDPMDMLSMSILVLFLGMYLNKKIKFLGDNYIPPAVTGGLLFSGGKALILLILVSAVFLVTQDATGVLLALLFDVHPGYGLMGGSVSLAGGHGTAIAWGAEAEAAGLVDASEVGIVFATLGLIAGGPIARYLIRRHKLETPAKQATTAEMAASTEPAAPGDQLFNILRRLMILGICVSVGDTVNRFLFDKGVLLPGFLTSMFVAVLITNLVASRAGR